MKTVSLELAKQLKENGYVQERSSFYHVKNPSGNWSIYDSYDLGREPENYASPTADELGELLPKRCNTHKSLDNDNEWVGWYSGDDHIFRAKTEADARAKIWLYLKKETLI